MMRDIQRLITICVPIETDKEWSGYREDQIDSLLDTLGNPAHLTAPAGTRLAKALDQAAMVHFASLSVIRATSRRERSYLVFELSVDGTARGALATICDVAGDQLLPVFALAAGIRSRSELLPLLLKHRKSLSAGFVRISSVSGLGFKGTPGLSVKRIRFEETVEAEARELIGQFRAGNCQAGRMPVSYLEAVRETADRNPVVAEALDRDIKPPFVDTDDAPWLKTPGKGAAWSFSRYLRQLWGYVAVVPSGIYLTLLVLWALFFGLGEDWHTHVGLWGRMNGAVDAFLWAFLLELALLLGAWYWLHRLEQANIPNDLDPDTGTVRAIMQRENRTAAQNQMIGITYIVPSLLRRFVTLPLALAVIEKSLKRRSSRPGFLGDIGTIHFARWFMLPGTRSLVFMSNYDGSWESYLEDFITKASAGMTGVWSNARGFPRTHNLFWHGAHDGDRFKRYARRSMIPTRFWYSAYPHLTAQQIRTNALIRDGIACAKTPDDAEAWLELFGSVPRPDYAVETDEIQNLLFGGSSHLSKGKCLLLRLPDRFAGTQASQWLASVRADLSFGAGAPRDRACYLALTYSGLRKIGLASPGDLPHDEDAPGHVPVTGLSPAFVIGMNDPTRSAILNDAGMSAPSQWRWGGPNNAVDMALVLYGANTDDSLGEPEAEAAQAAGLTVVETVDLTMLRDDQGRTIEPFGFVDGLSQPKLKGVHSNAVGHDTLHSVEPGEFVLGYRDNRGYFPPTLAVPEVADAGNELCGLPRGLPKRWPDFKTGQAAAEHRDFGRNGSYLVIRQLRQDVAGFEAWVRDTASASARAPGGRTISEATVAAKVMGRYKDGRSLLAVAGVSGELDNDFLYGADDPQGLKCPFGAHIRRANPRDSLNPDSAEELAITNRHRLLRRGRPYRKGEEEGLLFMCFNADLERQFEFVQQNWLASPNFHGLRNEVDPITGNRSVPYCGRTVDGFSLPDPVAPQAWGGLGSFVDMRGGAYFFMPSRAALGFLVEHVRMRARGSRGEGA